VALTADLVVQRSHPRSQGTFGKNRRSKQLQSSGVMHREERKNVIVGYLPVGRERQKGPEILGVGYEIGRLHGPVL